MNNDGKTANEKEKLKKIVKGSMLYNGYYLDHSITLESRWYYLFPHCQKTE